ncbi:hypothetical protein LCGC14_2030150, partial [marine sediment metagenome]
SIKSAVNKIVGRREGGRRVHEVDATKQTKIPDVDNIEPFSFFIPDDRSLHRFTLGLYREFQADYPKLSHKVSRARNGFEVKISGLPRFPDIKHRLSSVSAGMGGVDAIVPDTHKLV